MAEPTPGSGSHAQQGMPGEPFVRYGENVSPRISGVRPYLLTGGRVRPLNAATLNMAAQVLATWEGRAACDRLSYEHRDIVTLCVRPVSVAEIAAHLRLHLGVARVLVADLVALGYLAVRGTEVPANQQAQVIERVIRGLTAIR